MKLNTNAPGFNRIKRFSHSLIQSTSTVTSMKTSLVTPLGAQLQFTAWSAERSRVNSSLFVYGALRFYPVTFRVMSWVGFPMRSSGSVLYSRASGTVGSYRRQCFWPSNCKINTYNRGKKKALRTQPFIQKANSLLYCFMVMHFICLYVLLV